MTVGIRDAVSLVTGASSGIGREIARELAPMSRALVLVARRVERLEALANELRTAHPALVVDVRPCDLGEMAAVDELATWIEATHDRIDVLVNNAGVGQIGLFEASDIDQLDGMLRVNVLGLTRLTRHMLPGMVTRRRGAVLMVSSGFGLTWMPFFSAYVGSKHYVTAFSESLRTELSGTGVTITQLCPGPVATEFEQVAGNPTDQHVPAFIELSPQACARAGVRGLAAGRAMVIPGFFARIGITAGAMAPRWLLRLLYTLGGRLMRSRMAPARDPQSR
ncbi:MAG: SDR family oxidoreductase [Myxococcota bacterium]|nr:SDR family oxidoreductase [Myxococcota bacterium]